MENKFFKFFKVTRKIDDRCGDGTVGEKSLLYFL